MTPIFSKNQVHFGARSFKSASPIGYEMLARHATRHITHTGVWQSMARHLTSAKHGVQYALLRDMACNIFAQSSRYFYKKF